MNILIIGDGSAGQRYNRILNGLGHDPLIAGPRGMLEPVYPITRWDGIIIASPPQLHEYHLTFAVGQNAPILCEGPVTWNIAYSDKYYNCPHMTASNWRFVHSMQELAARLQDKYIVNAHLYFDYDLARWRDTNHRKTCYYQEGITRINLHEVDMALWLFGPAERVHVESRSTLKSLGMDAYSMMIKHTSGVLTTIQSSWHSATYRRGIVVQMADGSSEELSWQSPAHDTQINDSYQAVVERWLDAINDWDLTATPSLWDGYLAWQAINGVAI
jgi:predicted dehydrogenase